LSKKRGGYVGDHKIVHKELQFKEDLKEAIRVRLAYFRQLVSVKK
jgi:hypothetical protein